MERDVAVDRPAEFRVGAEQRRGEWIDYVQGVTAAMRARALPIRGFDARVESAVPLGAGLCSNAEAGACGSRAGAAFDLAIDSTDGARIARDAERRSFSTRGRSLSSSWPLRPASSSP